MNINDIAIALSADRLPLPEVVEAALEARNNYYAAEDIEGPLVYVGQVPDPEPWNSLNNKGTLHVFCAVEPWLVEPWLNHVLVFVVGQNRSALWEAEMPGRDTEVAKAANELLVRIGLGEISDDQVSRIDLAGDKLREIPLKERA